MIEFPICSACGNHPTCQEANDIVDRMKRGTNRVEDGNVVDVSIKRSEWEQIKQSLFDNLDFRNIDEIVKRIKELRNIESLSQQAVKFGIDIFRRIMK